MSEDASVFRGSENVFADIGLPDADQHLVKASLVHKMIVVMRDRGLTQAKTAGLLGIRPSNVSEMIRGRFESVSVEQLMRHLVALGLDVEIVVRPVPDGTKREAELRVA